MESFQSQLNALNHKNDLQELCVVWSYPVEWEKMLVLDNYKTLKLNSYNGKGFPNQYIYYFKS